MRKVIAVLCYLVFLANGESDSSSCKYDEALNKSVCNCHPNEDLRYFSGRGLIPLSVEVRSCASVTVDGWSGPTTKFTENYIFENITNTLNFSLLMCIEKMKSFKLLNIGNMLWLKSESFSEVHNLADLHIENSNVGLFENIFEVSNVTNITLKNVTIRNMEAIELNPTDRGYLHIIDCRIKVGNGNLIFEKFEKISISRTTFEFSTPGNITLVGNRVILNKITLNNTSIKIIGSEMIDIRQSCSYGKESRVRLKSPVIKSYGNKGPHEIEYETKQKSNQTGNEVCGDDDCKCHWDYDEGTEPNHAGTIYRSLFLLSTLVSYSLADI